MGRIGNREREGVGGAGPEVLRGGALLTLYVERGGAGRKCLEAAVKLVPLGSAVKNWPAVRKTQKVGVRSLVGKIAWSGKWHLTPVFLPEEFHGQRSLIDFRPKVPI